METGLIENTMSFEESLKQISPSDKNAKPIKVSLRLNSKESQRTLVV